MSDFPYLAQRRQKPLLFPVINMLSKIFLFLFSLYQSLANSADETLVIPFFISQGNRI